MPCDLDKILAECLELPPCSGSAETVYDQLRRIAYRGLRNQSDADECVSRVTYSFLKQFRENPEQLSTQIANFELHDKIDNPDGRAEILVKLEVFLITRVCFKIKEMWKPAIPPPEYGPQSLDQREYIQWVQTQLDDIESIYVDYVRPKLKFLHHKEIGDLFFTKRISEYDEIAKIVNVSSKTVGNTVKLIAAMIRRVMA